MDCSHAPFMLQYLIWSAQSFPASAMLQHLSCVCLILEGTVSYRCLHLALTSSFWYLWDTLVFKVLFGCLETCAGISTDTKNIQKMIVTCHQQPQTLPVLTPPLCTVGWFIKTEPKHPHNFQNPKLVKT